jgi:hypothetical protein
MTWRPQPGDDGAWPERRITESGCAPFWAENASFVAEMTIDFEAVGPRERFSDRLERGNARDDRLAVGDNAARMIGSDVRGLSNERKGRR